MATVHTILFSFIVVILIVSQSNSRSLSSEPERKIVCKPGESFKADCNSCICSPDGTTYYCTLMACLSTQHPQLYKPKSPINKRAIIKPRRNFQKHKRDVQSYADQGQVQDESYLDQLQQRRLQQQQMVSDQQREASELADQKQALQQQALEVRNQLELQQSMDELQRLLDAAQQELDEQQAQEDEYYGYDVGDYDDLQQEAAIDFKKIGTY